MIELHVAESSREAVTSGSATPKVRLSMPFDSTLPLRFWRKVYADPSGCWLWIGNLYPDGYGRFSVAGRTAHVYDQTI